jgi:hypothetical protein
LKLPKNVKGSISVNTKRAPAASLSMRGVTTMPLVLKPSRNATSSPWRCSYSRSRCLLRQTYLFQDGVMDNGPSAEEMRFIVADLRANTERLKLALKKLP